MAQEEFVAYGTIKIEGSSPENTRITVESEKIQFGRTIMLDSSGSFKIWLPYSKDYIIKFSKPGYQTVPFALSTKLPDNIAKCCFTPFDLSFHLFKPDGIHDSLFKKPIVSIRYEPKLKSYFYSLDIDYYIQKMYLRAKADHSKKVNDLAFIAKHKDSLEVERKYLKLINSGNVYYSLRQYNMARVMFSKALELKPKRRYPAYKIEDIETQVLIFNKEKDTLPQNVDSIVASLIKTQPDLKKQIEYKRKTPEEINTIFKNDLYKQIESETTDKKELAKRIQFINNEVINKQETIVAVIDTNKKGIDSNITINKDTTKQLILAKEIPIQKDSIVTTVPKEKPIPTDTTYHQIAKKDTVNLKEEPKVQPILKPAEPIKKQMKVSTGTKPFDKVAYQDSLLKTYPKEKTIEIITEPYKKITKIVINQNNLVSIYLKVEHKWGGIYFFKDNTPFPLENISKSYFEVATKLLQDKNKYTEIKKPIKNNTVKSQPKTNPVKPPLKTIKK